MAAVLRLTRMGKKKKPFYRIVAADSRVRRDGKYIEKVGHYDPITNPAEIVIDEDRAFYWLKNGAIPTDTVKNLFSQKGIMLKWHLKRQGCDDEKIEEEFKKWEVLQMEKQKRQEALAAQAKREPAQKESDEEAAPLTKEAETSESKEEAAPLTKEAEISESKEEAAPLTKEAEISESKEEAVPLTKEAEKAESKEEAASATEQTSEIAIENEK